MRTVCLVLVTVLMQAAPSIAQTPTARSLPQVPGSGATPLPLTADQVQPAGRIDVGVRLNNVSGDKGRFQRYRDLRPGPALDRVRYTRERETWLFDAEADHVGYRDGRYFASLERFGRLKTTFEWNQTPYAYGDTTRTPFRAVGPNVFRLDDTLQAEVENRPATIAAYEGEIAPFDTRSRRDVATARLAYSLTRNLDLRVALSSTRRGGEQPWGASFGFSNANELPVTVNHRTHDVTTAAEWSNRRGMVRVAYDGSWFGNAVETLTWDNPLRVTDQTHASAYSTGDGSSQGRMALWPDSTAHTVSASGSIALPARSRAFGHVSVGTWLQDDVLLPHTINTAIAPIPLSRTTAEAEARITSMNYRLTSRPTRTLWFSGQYRLYDYDNRTPRFPVDQYVRLDGNTAASVTGGSEPFAYTRHFVDLDASYTPWRFTAVRAGYSQELDDRTFRVFEQTTERVVRASIDSAGLAWGSVRVQYDRSVRTGDGLDEQVLSEIGEQVSLRQFDISDRTRDRVSAILQVVPADYLGISASLAIGQENRPDAAFGLQDNDLHALTVGLDLTPGRLFGATVTYGIERYGTRQQSRQANPGVQFNDPTRDWWTDMNERVHTVGLQLDLPRVTSRTAVTAGYDYVGSRATYLYTLAPNSTLAAPQRLPPVHNRIHLARADMRQTLTPRIGLALGYRFDGYDVEDFALSPGALNSALIPAFVNVLNQWRPYQAHTAFVKLLYDW